MRGVKSSLDKLVGVMRDVHAAILYVGGVIVEAYQVDPEEPEAMGTEAARKRRTEDEPPGDKNSAGPSNKKARTQ